MTNTLISILDNRINNLSVQIGWILIKIINKKITDLHENIVNGKLDKIKNFENFTKNN